MQEFEFHKLHFKITDDGFIRLLGFGSKLEKPHETEQFFVHQELQIAGGNHSSHHGAKCVHTSESMTLKYVSHSVLSNNDGETLEILTENENVRIASTYNFYFNTGTLRCLSKVTNISDKSLTLEYISSFMSFGFGKKGVSSSKDLYVHIPTNSWHCECQWKRYSFYDYSMVNGNGNLSMKRIKGSNTGSWSSKESLPMGMIEDTEQKLWYLWQIENAGSWYWEIGDTRDCFYLNISGPQFSDNHWAKNLKPNEVFESVPVAITMTDNMQEAFANMTKYRRKIRRKNEDNELMPTIFNEYMHAAWNAPNEENTIKLAKTAALAGVEYYVIDCGWHDEEEDCWHYIGKWRESKRRYPSGLKKTLDYIKSLGLKTGLWLELEAVGILGDAKEQWDDDCFFRRNGKPIVNAGRYKLDFRNKKVVQYMDDLIDRLIADYEIDYIKIDYNQCVGAGTELNSDSLGDGLLENSRTFINWLRKVLDKYPALVIESCASGGQRMDYDILSVLSIQSTSDQCDYKRYPYIVGNMLTAVTPEQAGVWSYPLEGGKDVGLVDDECVAFNMINSMLGRMHLSSFINKLDDFKQGLIKDGIAYYNQISVDKNKAMPYFPLGLCSWGDKVVSAGIKTDQKCYLAIYNLGGEKMVKVQLNGLKAKKVAVGYPLNIETEFQFENNEIRVNFTDEYQARLFEVDLI